MTGEQGIPSIVRTTTRTFVPPSCELSAQELRDLFDIAKKLADEASERVIAIHALENPTQSDLVDSAGTALPSPAAEDLKRRISQALEMRVLMRGSDGELAAGTTKDLLNDDALPDTIDWINFDSCFAWKAAAGGNNPEYLVLIELDFSRTPVIDFSNISGTPTPNLSKVTVTGQDSTWVNGAISKLQAYFQGRSSRRTFLHGPHVYNFYVVTVLLPLGLWGSYKIHSFVERYVAVLAIPVAIYSFILLAYFFRIGFNLVRWVSPRLEGPTKTRAVAPALRKTVWILFVGILASLLAILVYEIVEALMAGDGAG